jgi:hypothetical protein
MGGSAAEFASSGRAIDAIDDHEASDGRRSVFLGFLSIDDHEAPAGGVGGREAGEG